MTRSAPSLKTQPLFPVAIGAAVTALYWRLLVTDPLLHRDDLHIIEFKHGWKEIWYHATHHDWRWVFGVQILRDGTLFLDDWIQSTTGVASHHLSNLLVWFAVLFFAHRILRRLYPNAAFVPWAIACLAVHPVSVGSVAWVSARKHLVAAALILAATSWFLKRVSTGSRGWASVAGIFFLYATSLFSHPIGVGWPLFALLYLACQPGVLEDLRSGVAGVRKRLSFFAPALVCLPLMWIDLQLNTDFYNEDYLGFTGAVKYMMGPPPTGALFEPYGVRILAAGRYFLNALAPIRVNHVYYPGSPWNFVGFLVLGLVFSVLVWTVPWRRWLPWMGFFFFPLAPVVVNLTNIFVSDTYILISLVGVVPILVELVPVLKLERWKDHIAPIGMACAAIFVTIDLPLIEAWGSDFTLWETTVHREASPRSTQMAAYWELETGHPDEALEHALRLRVWDPNDRSGPYLLSRAVYLDNRMTPDEKLAFLASHDSNLPWFRYYVSAVQAQAGDFRGAYANIRRALQSPWELEPDLGSITAEAVYFCRLADAAECERIPSSVRTQQAWDEDQYVRRLNQLEME